MANNTSYELLLFNALKNGQNALRSTYDVWVSLGNVGTPQDFIDSLRGQSAYQIWLEQGNQGSEQEFLDSLGGGSGAVTAEQVTAGDTQTLNSAKAYTDSKLGTQVTFEVQGSTLIITPIV